MKTYRGSYKRQICSDYRRCAETSRFFSAMFFDGDITELDRIDSKIYLVLPEGEYEITSKLNSENIYMLDLKINKNGKL